jgi:hypothetical protein
MANIEAPPQSAPPSALGGAKSISAAELGRELTAPPRQEAAPTLDAPPTKGRQIFREDNASNVTLGDDKGNREVEPTLPDFRAKAREMMKKKESAPAEEQKVESTKAEAAPVKKEAVSADDAPPAKAVATTDEVPEEHRRVLPQDKPDTAKRIKAILAERDAERAAKAALAAERDAAKAELDAAKKSGAAPEEIAKLRAEYDATKTDLLRYRRRYEIDSDPEFAAKYKEPVKVAEKAIEDTFKKYNFGEGTLKAIADAGGFGAFSTSAKTFQVQEADPENPGKTRPVVRTAAELSREWLNSLPIADSEAIRATLGKQSLLRSEEQQAITKAQDEAKTHFENLSKSQQEAHRQQQEATQKQTAEYEKWLTETETATDWLKDRPIPDGATEAQRKEITDHNEFNGQLRSQLKKHPTTALEYGQLKLEAAEAHHLRRTKGQLEARIAELENQVKRGKDAQRTTPRGGSLLRSDEAVKPARDANADPTDFKAGLRAGLGKITGSIDE